MAGRRSGPPREEDLSTATLAGSGDSADARSAAADAADYPPSYQGWFCVFALALASTINFLDRGILTLLVEPIKTDLALSDIQMGLVMGFAFTFFYAIFGLPVARLVDRHSRKHIMAAGITIWSLMTNFWQLFLARVGVGVGETTSGPSAYSMLADYFPPQKLPRAIAGMNMGFVAGVGLSMIIGAAVIDFIAHAPPVTLPILGTPRPWQLVLFAVGLPGLLVAALMLTVREPPRRGIVKRESAPIGEVFGFLAHYWPVFVPMFLGLALRSVQMFGLQMWGPVFYGRTFGWSPQQIGYLSGLSLIVAMPIGLYLGSWIAERWWKQGRHDANIRVVVYSSFVSVPLAILGPLMPNPWLALGLGFFAFIFNGMAAPPENAALQSVTPNHLRGQVTFLFLFIMNVIGMGLGPLVVASLTQYVYGEEAIRYSLATASSIMGPAALIVFWLGMKPYGRAMAAGGALLVPDRKPKGAPT
jgi:MFS family permease